MLIATLFVLGFITVVIQIGVFWLQHTGMEKSDARFQAISLLVGMGSTPSVTEHPIRRKVASLLMLIGYLGSAALIALMFQVVKQASLTQTLISIGIIAVICIVVWVDLPADFVRNHILKKLRTHYTKNVPYQLMQLDPLHIVSNVKVTERMGFDGQTIENLPLRALGLLLMAIIRKDETIHIPAADTIVHEGDTLILYGDVAGVEIILKMI